MITAFEQIPEEFVRRYEPWISEWGKKFQKWGARCRIPLVGPTVGVPKFDDHGQRPVVVVVLEAEKRGAQMVVRPADYESADRILRHVAALRGVRPEMLTQH